MTKRTGGNDEMVEVTYVLPKATLGAITHYVDLGLFRSEEHALDVAGGLLLWASEIVARGEQVASFDEHRVVVSPISFLDPSVVMKFSSSGAQNKKALATRPVLRLAVDNTTPS